MTNSLRHRALSLPSPEATTALARHLAQQLCPGDVLLFTGGIGAGKTHFARSLIQAILQEAEDVPSPTFTLVQEYETTRGPLWHSDLYRLGSVDEVEELGLLDAFTDAICLIEWPDRLGDLTPEGALHLTLSAGEDPDRRELTVMWSDPKWDARLSDSLIAGFLSGAGWDDAEAQPIAGDASARQYTRLSQGGETAILMNDPDGDTALFARLARHLTGIGLSAPQVRAEAPGLLLLEDLGDGLLARLATDQPRETELYVEATRSLIALHQHPAPEGLPVATPDVLAQATDLAFTHYADLPHLAQDVAAAFLPILSAHAAPEGVMVLRDFHAENALLLDRPTPARIGLLDFQDALVGHAAYDLVSLCRDVRREVSALTEAACIDTYLTATGRDRAAFDAAYAVLGVQRNLRILGVFARLAQGGKPRYLDFLPRTWAHLQDQLAHPALAPLRPLLAQLPAPDEHHIERLASKC